MPFYNSEGKSTNWIFFFTFAHFIIDCYWFHCVSDVLAQTCVILQKVQSTPAKNKAEAWSHYTSEKWNLESMLVININALKYNSVKIEPEFYQHFLKFI